MAASFLMLSSHAFAATALPPAKDLKVDAEKARRDRVPIVVMVSLDGCPHCETVRRSHLLPLLRAKNPAVILRQVELNGSTTLIDFDGRKTTHAEFAQRHRATIAPVVLFFDAEGRSAAEPIVGASIPDFYGAYLEKALADARLALPALPPLKKGD
jgi:thioredoxin-related protein